MKITKVQIPVRDLVTAYDNNEATGRVSGYNGKLDIRPEYQREFIYDDKRQKAVMETIVNGFPLNTMYWVRTNKATEEELNRDLTDDEIISLILKNGTFEVLDGQQRTISICKYVKDKSYQILIPTVSTQPVGFGALEANATSTANEILDYKLDVYICDGTDTEKLAWFRVINTAGVQLTEQELRNATYAGTWVSSAKAYFSRSGGKGVNAADKNDGKSQPLLTGKWNRQEYLETAIEWIANKDGLTIEQYMEKHQDDADASELWRYFNSVMEWVRSKFTNYRKAMCGLPWGIWYNECMAGKHDGNIIAKDASTIEKHISDMIADDELKDTPLKGIYLYIYDGHVSHLTIREFEEKDARIKYEEQKHKCPRCQAEGNEKEYEFDEMDADHIIPWIKGGKTELSNCQMLCQHHNRSKGSK